MAYTAIDDPEAYFQVKLYTGDGSTPSITLDGDTDMQPDMVWIKNRDETDSHCLFDSVRGATKVIHADATDTETTDADTLTSFDSDGFALGADVKVNTDTEAYVAWCWKAGTGTATNTNGSEDTTVNVNTTSGFSIVTWTGTGNAETFGHSLGANGDVVIIKNRGSDSVDGWYVNHNKVASTETLFLNTNAAEATSAIYLNTAPDSTSFRFDSDQTEAHVAYCFSAKQGFSKFGSYEGNSDADGTFVYTGFRPAFLLYKNTNNANGWGLTDNKRETFNVMGDNNIQSNSSGAESGNSAYYHDFLSNGFKARTADDQINRTGDVYIYMAFAEAPFVNSNGVPCNAR